MSLLGTGVALACNLGGWLTVTAGPQEGQLTVLGGEFPPGDVLVRSGNTSGPVIAEVVAGPDGRFEATISVPEEARPDTKILAEPVEQPDPGSRVHAWTFIGADALELPGGLADASSPLAIGLVAISLLAAAGLWLRARRSDLEPPVDGADADGAEVGALPRDQDGEGEVQVTGDVDEPART